MEKISQFGQQSISDEKFLIDRDCEIFETIMSQFDPYELSKLTCDRFRDFHDYLHIWDSNLGKFIIPQTYLSEKRVVVSENWSIIFYINAEHIIKMITLLENLNSKTWNQLKSLGVNILTSIIMDATKLIRNNNLV
jgi:hypothetical protein